MTLRGFLIPTACAITTLMSACDGDSSVRLSSNRGDTNDAKGVLKVVDALQCPLTMGALTRKGSAQASGTVCTYVGPKGAEVSLHLIALDGDQPAKIMRDFEQRLSRSLPAATARLKAASDAEKATAQGDTAEASAGQIPAGGDAAPAQADRARVSGPGVMIDAKNDDASVRLPGMSIEAKGDQASIRIGSFQIEANDSTGSARVRGTGRHGESVIVNAQDDAAEVRTSAGGDATRASWILTDTRDSETGWRLVGFEARGPVGGPLVVATVRSRDADRDHAFRDAKDLVTLNVGE